ncbi:hypothetical protein FOA52_005769 [Chlamydomonas sp. UWO 241]|nr:hypothetical protein FOA52_005769 [Chlamydomonas sp. UWO 241]
MVHIPFLNIEVGEVRLAELIPDVVEGGVRLCTRAMDAGMRATHPLPPVIEEALVEEVLENYPREIKRVLLRAGEGKHKDEDGLSSEIEEASYAFYRRMIRTSCVGDTEEDQEDVTAYKLGLDRPSASARAWRMHEIEQAERAGEAGPALAWGEEEELAMQAALAAAGASSSAGLAVADGALTTLRSRVRRDGMQGASSAVNAGLGLALAVVVIKGCAMLTQQLLRLRPKGKKAKPKAKPAPRGAATWELPPVGGGSTPAAKGGKGAAAAAAKQETPRTSTRTTTRKR